MLAPRFTDSAWVESHALGLKPQSARLAHPRGAIQHVDTGLDARFGQKKRLTGEIRLIVRKPDYEQSLIADGLPLCKDHFVLGVPRQKSK